MLAMVGLGRFLDRCGGWIVRGVRPNMGMGVREHRDSEQMTRIEYGTMTGTDLIALREALDMTSSDFGYRVLGNSGDLKTVNRWIRRLESMDLIPSGVQERIRCGVRDQIRELVPAAYMLIDAMAAVGRSPEDIADVVNLNEDIVRTCLLPPLKVTA